MDSNANATELISARIICRYLNWNHSSNTLVPQYSMAVQRPPSGDRKIDTATDVFSKNINFANNLTLFSPYFFELISIRATK